MKINQKFIPFLWGVATSAFQIEGDIENDMTDWEVCGRFDRDGKNPRYNNAFDRLRSDKFVQYAVCFKTVTAGQIGRK